MLNDDALGSEFRTQIVGLNAGLSFVIEKQMINPFIETRVLT